jgi:hypothetical protein
MNEAIVYFVVSRERGPEERIFKEEDVQAEGGVHALEILLEKQSYWFVQLGEVRGELGPYGLIFPDSEFVKLPAPPENEGRVGRRNPAFRGSELERRLFEVAFEAVEQTIVIIKFWYDASRPEPHLPGDLVLGEYSIKMALQIRWSARDRIVRIDVMPIASC